MKRIYVTFGNLVVQYEIKGLATQFVETERIQVKKNCDENCKGHRRVLYGQRFFSLVSLERFFN